MDKNNPVGSLLREELKKRTPTDNYESRIADLEREVQWLIREVQHLREGTTP